MGRSFEFAQSSGQFETDVRLWLAWLLAFQAGSNCRRFNGVFVINIDAEDFSFSLPFVGGELLLAAFRMRGERGSESVEPEMAAGSVFFVWGPDLCQAGCGHESAQFRKHNGCSHKIAVESSHAFRLARQQPGGQEGQACGTGRGRK